MPIYEFRCDKCNNIFEKLLFSEGEEISCPVCGSKDAGRVLSVCGFKTIGDKGVASSRMSGTKGSSCVGCKATSCKTCH